MLSTQLVSHMYPMERMPIHCVRQAINTPGCAPQGTVHYSSVEWTVAGSGSRQTNLFGVNLWSSDVNRASTKDRVIALFAGSDLTLNFDHARSLALCDTKNQTVETHSPLNCGLLKSKSRCLAGTKPVHIAYIERFDSIKTAHIHPIFICLGAKYCN